MKGSKHDEPKPAWPTESIAGAEARSAAGRRSETGPAEPGSGKRWQKSQTAARPNERHRYVTDRDGPLRRAVFFSCKEIKRWHRRVRARTAPNRFRYDR